PRERDDVADYRGKLYDGQHPLTVDYEPDPHHGRGDVSPCDGILDGVHVAVPEEREPEKGEPPRDGEPPQLPDEVLPFLHPVGVEHAENEPEGDHEEADVARVEKERLEALRGQRVEEGPIRGQPQVEVRVEESKEILVRVEPEVRVEEETHDYAHNRAEYHRPCEFPELDGFQDLPCEGPERSRDDRPSLRVVHPPDYPDGYQDDQESVAHVTEHQTEEDREDHRV